MALIKVYLNTTGIPGSPNPIIVADFGAMQFSHPTVDFDLIPYVSVDEIFDSNEIATYIDNGWITLTNVDDEIIDPRDPTSGGSGTGSALFGTRYQQAKNLEETSTTVKGVNVTNKVTLNVPTVPTGKYLLWYSAEGSNSSNNKETKILVQQDGSELANISRVPPKTDTFFKYSGFIELDNYVGNESFTIDYARVTDGQAKVRNAKLMFWRIS